MKKILFIHGFASSGQSQKAQDLHHILGCEVIAPDLSHQPFKDIAYLEQLVEQHQIEMIVGSSLGGFYALLLGQKKLQKLLLINPSLTPHITLKDKLGFVESFKGQGFDWSTNEVAALADLYDQLNLSDLEQQPLQQTLKQSVVLLAKHDERLNYQEAQTQLHMPQVIIDQQQDHRFADISQYQAQIRALYASK